MVQLYITFPSTITLQAPQVPRSQTRFEAVMSSRLRNVSHRVNRGSTLTLRLLPLILSVMGTSPGPAVLICSASASDSSSPVDSAPLVTPTLVRKPRREKFSFEALSSLSFLELKRHLPFARITNDLIRRRKEEGKRYARYMIVQGDTLRIVGLTVVLVLAAAAANEQYFPPAS